MSSIHHKGYIAKLSRQVLLKSAKHLAIERHHFPPEYRYVSSNKTLLL